MNCKQCNNEIKPEQAARQKCGKPVKEQQKNSNTTCIILAIIFGVIFFFGIFIIGMLTAIALPQYYKAVEKARTAEVLTVINTIAHSQQRYKTKNADYTNNFENLDLSFSNFQGVLSVKDNIMQTDNFIITINPPQIHARRTQGTMLYTLIKDIPTNRTSCRADNDSGDLICHSLYL